MVYFLKKIFFSLLLVSLMSGCHHALVLDPAGFVAEEVSPPPLLLPSDSLDRVYDGLKDRRAVMAFYQEFEYSPAWMNSDYSVSDSLMAFIGHVRYYGLLPQHYHLTELFELQDRKVPSPEDRLRADVLLTDAFLNLAKHLRQGTTHVSISDGDAADIPLLRRVLASGEIRNGLRQQEPVYHGYRALKRALKALLDNADVAEREVLLRGLTADTIPLHDTIRLVEINLERWRWEKHPLGERYIFVNIPSFMVQVISGEVSVFESRTIVGRPQNPTPVFSSMVQCFVTYPYWHVPRSISVGEFLPLIKKDTAFIRRNNFDILDRKGNVLDPGSVDWTRFSKDNFPVVLRQRDGPENSLGIIKFVFDNPYAVFLHDTNSPRLFRNEHRALSHGCIRVEKAVALAHLLATGQPGSKSPVLEKFLHQKLRHSVDLSESMPIHLRYFTASFSSGRLEIFEDIYKQDRGLMDRIYAGDLPVYP